MIDNLKELIDNGFIHVPTDCIFCFGTGTMYPNELGVYPCIDEDCEAGQKEETFYGGYSSHRQVLCRTGIVWNMKYLEEFGEEVCDGIDHLENFARVAWVDVGLYPIIIDLWKAKIDTLSSCQGGLFNPEEEIQSAYVALCIFDDKKIDLARAIISKYGIITSEEDNRDSNEQFSDYVFRWQWK